MTETTNPYQPPEVATEQTVSEPDGSDGCTWRFFIVLWSLEGAIKLCAFVVLMLRTGFDLEPFVEMYLYAGHFWFALGYTFFVIETIGPWFGVYYLIRQRREKSSFGEALWKIIVKAGFWSLIITAVTMITCELVLWLR